MIQTTRERGQSRLGCPSVRRHPYIRRPLRRCHGSCCIARSLVAAHLTHGQARDSGVRAHAPYRHFCAGAHPAGQGQQRAPNRCAPLPTPPASPHQRPQAITVHNPSSGGDVLKNRKESWTFKFHNVLHNASQDTVYETVAKDIVRGVMQGVNGACSRGGRLRVSGCSGVTHAMRRWQAPSWRTGRQVLARRSPWFARSRAARALLAARSCAALGSDWWHGQLQAPWRFTPSHLPGTQPRRVHARRRGPCTLRTRAHAAVRADFFRD